MGQSPMVDSKHNRLYYAYSKIIAALAAAEVLFALGPASCNFIYFDYYSY